MSGQVGWGTTQGMEPSLLEALGWKEYIEIASQPYPEALLAEARLRKADRESIASDCRREVGAVGASAVVGRKYER